MLQHTKNPARPPLGVDALREGERNVLSVEYKCKPLNLDAGRRRWSFQKWLGCNWWMFLQVLDPCRQWGFDWLNDWAIDRLLLSFRTMELHSGYGSGTGSQPMGEMNQSTFDFSNLSSQLRPITLWASGEDKRGRICSMLFFCSNRNVIVEMRRFRIKQNP